MAQDDNLNRYFEEHYVVPTQEYLLQAIKQETM